MRNKRNPDLLARVLASAGQFRGKARLVDLLGQLASSWTGGRGTFSVVNGETATIDLGDRIQRLMWGAAYEPDVRKCVVALLRPGDTFVDVGAHIGFFSLLASSLVGSQGKVYAFEADTTLFQILHSNALAYPWLVPSLRAVWNESGSATFSNPRQTGESGWGKLAVVRNEGHTTSVQAISLDDWYENVSSPPIRLIKIDAEGSEPFILEGAQRVIASTRPYLIIELNDNLLREVGKDRAIIADSLREQAYRLFAIGPKDLYESRGVIDPAFSEILCVPSERLEESMAAISTMRPKQFIS